jgi:hypothetical protein
VRRRLFPLLAGALADPRSFPGVEPAELDRLIALADYHRVTGQLAAAFAGRGAIPAAVTQARQVATVGSLQTLEGLRRAAGALDRAGIGWVVLKGPALATRWYRDPAARSYQDLDLLVDPAGLAAAVDALAGVGFAERSRNWAGLRSVGAGEIALVDERIMIDLHWHVVALERDRRPLRFRTADLLQRRRPLELGSVPAFSLDDADMLGHAVLHAQLNGAHLLLHLRDAHLVAGGVDWPSAARRLTERRVDRAAAAILARAERVLGPAGAGGTALAPTLGHPGWRGLNRAADAAWAELPGVPNPFPSALVIASRPTALATAGEVLVRSGGAIRARLGRPTVTRSGGPLDPDVDGGGRAERARYFRDVEQGAFGW